MNNITFTEFLQLSESIKTAKRMTKEQIKEFMSDPFLKSTVVGRDLICLGDGKHVCADGFFYILWNEYMEENLYRFWSEINEG